MEQYYVAALRKLTKKPIPSLKYYVIKHQGSTLLEGYYSSPKLFNTLAIPLVGYPTNTVGSIIYLLKLGRVMHSPTKTYKENNTLIPVLEKQYGLNYFGIDY
jgi:hypothetical protein